MNKKLVLALIATGAIVGTSFAMYGQGKWQGNWMWQWRTDKTIVDTNNNGITDGQEDWDNDGVINRDDPDYEKSYVNAKDDDSDGIPNSQDEDYVRPQDGSGKPANAGQGRLNVQNRTLTNTSTQTRTMINVPTSAQKYMNQAKVAQYKGLIEQKYKAKLDSFSQERIQTTITKIDTLLEKIINSTVYSNTKKESYTNILVALKASLINRLEDTDIIDNLLN